MTASAESRCSQPQRATVTSSLIMMCAASTEGHPRTGHASKRSCCSCSVVSGDLADLCLGFYLTQIARRLEMDTGQFEPLSECWSSEQQPAMYYRTAAAQARRLQAETTTPRVKEYFDKMIAHCERLAGKVEPGLSSARSATIRRSKGFIIGPRSSKSMSSSF
jgi:hypothetical protein